MKVYVLSLSCWMDGKLAGRNIVIGRQSSRNDSGKPAASLASRRRRRRRRCRCLACPLPCFRPQSQCRDEIRFGKAAAGAKSRSQVEFQV